MIFNRKLINVLLDADGGGEGTGTGAVESAEATSATTESAETGMEVGQQAEAQYERPKYFAQLNKEKADSEDYKSLYKYQKIEDLADAFIAQGRDVEAVKEKYKDSIVVPKSDDAEGLKSFKSALGIPETADGYTLTSLKNVQLDDETRKMIRDTAYGAMLSDKQADAIGVALLKSAQMAGQALKAQRENAVKTFDTTLTASYKDIANEADRKNTAERDKASYEHFMNESGLKDYLDDRGLSYDPAFVKAIAQYARKHTGSAPQSNLPTTAPNNAQGTGEGQTPAGFYGSAFSEAFKK